MTDNLQTLWHAQAAENAFTQPDDLMQRTSSFERQMRRRNLIEYLAGGFVLALSIPAAVLFASIGLTGMALSMALVALGVVVVLWNLRHRASAEVRRPEEECRTHLLAQYRRQADALRKVPLWYIGPLIPGVLGVYATVGFMAAGQVDLWDLVVHVGAPLAATLAFFGFVIWLNLRAARKLAAQAKALEEA
ncbi:MAG: hypothetical protein CL803_07850 [Citromicrobium sp.]|nr:hypothetical protein [Citromicrobium sp.]MAO96270.1 hypothetical protein [Citromicrobium sp.]MAS85534.1 hypothetical protein [Erythrobacteraceae bacterium]MBT47354.1 hypothetical protein [Citromicrobium sp.]|tara:strand:- start:203 stop:775 length:573 start_codon:yes stop_codon:yes gene_type:complete